MNTIDEENKNSISDVTNTLNEAKDAIDKAKNEAKIVNRKANNMQKENKKDFSENQLITVMVRDIKNLLSEKNRCRNKKN
jgi:DNA topoisomerase VI subunit B